MKANLAYKAKLTGKYAVEWHVEQPRVMKCVKARLLMIVYIFLWYCNQQKFTAAYLQTSTD